MKSFGLFSLLLGVTLLIGCGGGPSVDDVVDDVGAVEIEGIDDAGDAGSEAATYTADVEGGAVDDAGAASDDGGAASDDAAGGDN